MSNIYVVLPTGEVDEATRHWFEGERVQLPEQRGRWPRPSELRAALEGFDGYTVAYRQNTDRGWDAELRRDTERATIWVKDAPADDRPWEFSFHKPDEELALRILERLSHGCGPFAIVEGSAARVVVVTPGCDPAALAASWHRDR